MKLLPFPILLLTVTVFSASLAACAAPIPAATFTPAPTSAPTETPIPPTATQTPAPPTETATATVTPEILAPITIVTDLEHLSQADVVADGQEAAYAKRILAAYQSGQIEKFDSSLTAPKIEIWGINEKNIMLDRLGHHSIILPHLEDYDNYDAVNVKPRPERIVDFVQDGQGGYRVIQLWLQKDGTPGLVWYHIPKNTNVAYSDFEGILSGKYYNEAVLPGEFKNKGWCTNLTGDAPSCATLMAPENVAARRAALQEWVDTGFIPQAMQDGTIQFPLSRIPF